MRLKIKWIPTSPLEWNEYESNRIWWHANIWILRIWKLLFRKLLHLQYFILSGSDVFCLFQFSSGWLSETKLTREEVGLKILTYRGPQQDPPLKLVDISTHPSLFLLRKQLLNLSPGWCFNYLQRTIWHGRNNVYYSPRFCSVFGKYCFKCEVTETEIHRKTL